MEQKTPRGVTVVAWLTIIGSVLSLFYRKEGISINDYLLLVIPVLSIVAAIYLLQLKEWARITIIILDILTIILTIILVIFLVKPVFSITKLGLASDIAPLNVVPIFIVVVSFLGLNLIISGAIIYYLTRPKVREQFK